MGKSESFKATAKKMESEGSLSFPPMPQRMGACRDGCHPIILGPLTVQGLPASDYEANTSGARTSAANMARQRISMDALSTTGPQVCFFPTGPGPVVQTTERGTEQIFSGLIPNPGTRGLGSLDLDHSRVSKVWNSNTVLYVDYLR